MPGIHVNMNENTHLAVRTMAQDMGVSLNRLVLMALDSYMDGIEIKQYKKVESKLERRQISVHMPEDLFEYLSDLAEAKKVSMGSLARVAVLDYYKDAPRPTAKTPQKRVPRDPALTQRVMMETGAAKYNDNKTWKKGFRPGGERNPTERTPLCECRIEGCPKRNWELHAHFNSELTAHWAWVDEQEAKLRKGHNGS